MRKITPLKFHETFSPQIKYISKLLLLAKDEYVGDKISISNATGIPTGKSSGKVDPHIKYAVYMNLITAHNQDNKRHLKTTSFGDIVVKNDPYFIESVTKSLLNFFLSNELVGADHWRVMTDMLYENLSIAVSFERQARKASEYFGEEVELGVVRNSYKQECFEGLDLILSEGNTSVMKKRELRLTEINAIAYAMMWEWDAYFNDIGEITCDDMLDKMSWYKSFGLDETEIHKALDEMRNEGYISLNKQLRPMTIIRMAQTDECGSRIYSSLL